MSSCFHLHFMSLLLAVAAIRGSYSTEKVKFTVDPEGDIFLKKNGVANRQELMSMITTKIWGSILGQSVDVVGKVHKISLFIDESMTAESSYRDLQKHVYEVHLGKKHIEKCKDNALEEIRMLLTYEITHVLQYTADGNIPIALMNGIAAYAVISLGRKPSRWAEYGEGDIWDQSPQVTGQFLYYCSKAHDGFVEKLNKKMENVYDKEYFYDISGKTLDGLWMEYKAKYGS